MKETYEVGPGQTVTVSVQVDGALSSAVRPLDQAKARIEELEDKAAEAGVEIHRLEKALAESRDLVEFKESVAAEIDDENDRLRGKIRELIAERKEAINGRDLALGEIDTLRQKVRSVGQLQADRAAAFATQARHANDRAAALAVKVSQLQEEVDAQEKRFQEEVHAQEHLADRTRKSLLARDRLLDTATRQLRNISRVVAADRPHIQAVHTIPWTGWTEKEATDLGNTIREIQEMTAPWSDNPETSTSQA